MAYSTGDFNQDAEVVARTLHLSYRRCKYFLDRWWGGMNAEFPNEGAGIPINNLASRVAELVADYDAASNAKLNTVMAMSNLKLPGDA